MWFLCPSRPAKCLAGALKPVFSLALARGIATNQPDPTLVILNPRQAGLVKTKPRRPRRRGSKPVTPTQPITPLDTLDENKIQEPVVTAIHSQRPESAGITRHRFEQIRDDLVRGFKKSHLEDYLKAQKVQGSLYKRLTKPKMAQFIMTGVWNCFVRDEGHQLGDGAFVENILELSEQELVLILGGNGRLLREWSKSGARLSISPSRTQIIVNSTQETFDWINASLSHFLETKMATEVDITELKKLADGTRLSEHLAAIQQLTDTFFSGTNKGANDPADSIVVYSAGNNKIVNTNVAKRLMVQLTQPALIKTWKPAEWWFDTALQSQAESYFHPFDDSDSMEWMERMRTWSRWEAVKTKNKVDVSQDRAYDLNCLNTPEFSPSRSSAKETSSLSSQIEQVIHQLVERHPTPKSLNGEPVSTTLTITPGYVLHESDGKSFVPNAGTSKTFCSNIPSVANFASTLPLYSKDIRQEDVVEQDSIFSSYENSSEGTTWSDILNADSTMDAEGRKVFVSRRKELDLRSNLRLIQMKFVANPEQGLATKYPPVEAWAELPPFNVSNNSLLQQIPRIVAVPMEANSHISLPNHKADFKVSLAHTYPIETTQEIEEYFLKHCRFGRVGPIEIKPELNVKFGDESVSYLYHSAAYVTLAELEFRNDLLQLSQVEGGKLGGRKIEASIVEHAENAEQFDVAPVAKRAVESALALADLM